MTNRASEFVKNKGHNLPIQNVSQRSELLAIEALDKIIKADVNGTASKIARAYKKSIANCG